MFPTLQEFINAIRGAWGLMLWDDQALENFDQSIQGFWTSFAAPIAAFPAYILYILANQSASIQAAENLPEGSEIPPIPPTQALVTSASLTYMIGVILFPLLMIPFTRRLGLSHRFVPFIIARNWVNAVITFLLAAPSLLFLAGLFSGVATLGLIMLISIGAYAALFFTALTALQASRQIAISVVLIDFIIGIIGINLTMLILT